jgi:hypothetical protein
MYNQQQVNADYNNMYNQQQMNMDYGNMYNQTSPKQMTAGVFGQIMSLIKSPVTAGAEYVSSGNAVTALALIVLQGILSGLFALTICLKLQSLMNTLINLMTGSSSSSLYSSYSSAAEIIQMKTLLKIPVFKGFIFTALMSVVLSFILALIMFLGNMIIGSKMNFTQIMSLVSLRSLAASFMVLLGILISLINVSVGFSIFFMGNIAGFIFMSVVQSRVSEETANKQILMMIIAYILFVVAFALSIRLCWTMYLPSALKLMVDQIKSSVGDIFNNPKNLLNLLDDIM